MNRILCRILVRILRRILLRAVRINRVYPHPDTGTHEYTHAYTGFAYRVLPLRFIGVAIEACVSGIVSRILSRKRIFRLVLLRAVVVISSIRTPPGRAGSRVYASVYA